MSAFYSQRLESFRNHTRNMRLPSCSFDKGIGESSPMVRHNANSHVSSGRSLHWTFKVNTRLPTVSRVCSQIR